MGNILEHNLPVMMIRPDLEGLPQHPLPAGYALRFYAPGDEAAWRALQAAADELNPIDETTFTKAFGADPALHAERVQFLLDSVGQFAGTSTAWSDDLLKRPGYGRVHWVAIHPEQQGRGLAKPLLAATLHRLKDLGHRAAYLTTSSSRPVALNLYLRFGFLPAARSAEERKAWEELARHLKAPFKTMVSFEKM